MKPDHQLLLTLAGLPLAGLLGGCSPEPAAPDPGVALEIDGLSIRADELSQFEDYFQALDPAMGRDYRTREALDQFVLPLHLARRAFADERAAAKEEAEALRAQIGDGGYYELERQGQVYGGYRPERPFGRNGLPFPVARFAFDDANVFAVSAPIETAQGYCLIAARRILRGNTTVEDQVEAYFVPFYTHTSGDFAEWYRARQQHIRDRVTYVHRDFRGAMPPWMRIQ